MVYSKKRYFDYSAQVHFLDGKTGVPIGTPDFITRFVEQKVKEYANDVDKLDILQDGKVHFDLLKFCHMPRFNYLNGLVLTPSLFSAQQHHFDFKVHDALIRKGTHKPCLLYTSPSPRD